VSFSCPLKVCAGATVALAFCVHPLRAQETLEPPPVPETGTPATTPAPQASPEPSAPPLSRRQLLDGLSEEDVEKAIAAVKKSFLDAGAASDAALRRSALEGLMVRFDPGVEIVPGGQAAAAPEPHSFLAEILDAHIGYIRLGAIDAAAMAQFESTLKSFPAAGVHSLILDLRSVRSGGDFEVAAEFARRLCNKGTLLFTLQKPSAKQERLFTANRDPDFTGVLIVLTDARTSGPAEALAATLRANAGAMIVGSDTAGAPVEFESIPLGGGSILRLAVSQVLLPESGPLYPRGVKPDIPISLDPGVQNQIFRESVEKGVSQFVFEMERRRMNEASLVANTNPEIDSARTNQRERGQTPPYRDLVLQRAVDLATAIQFYKKDRPR
jgi:hypothetical protein